MDDLNGIAIIGMAGKFPEAENIEEFWKNLIEGKDCITHFTNEQLSKSVNNFESVKDNPNYVKAKGILKDIEMFDAGFLGVNPYEAKITDPQHRIWLETAWQALENAACDPFTYKGSIGIFAGTSPNAYLFNHIFQNNEEKSKFNNTYSTESFQLIINNDPGYLPTKTAYKFNLKGPAINVQTACSTSLVAVAQACQSLYNFESDICIAGSSSVDLPQVSGYYYQKGAISSPNGQCRPFDIESQGTVPSNGVGVVILKRLEDAIEDKDQIYAVIKGWATNNDGSNKVSYLAPSVDGQAEVIMMAQAFAEIDPEEISYIEAHGTATPLGDPIEIAGLTKAFRNKTDKKQFCGIGSVKSNIGHIDATAGIAGLIKSSLAVKHKIIPPSINFNSPNPNIDIENSPFYVQNEKKVWDENKTLNIGISSFGIGGTNSHVIIQEPPVIQSAEYKQERPHLILLSAKSKKSLSGRKNDLIEFAKNNQGTNLHELAYTLQTGRSNMPLKSYAVVNDINELSSEKILDSFNDSFIKESSKTIAFMFPGQGAQYLNMGKDLYLNEPACREIFDTCFLVFENETGVKLQEILFSEDPNEEGERILASTEYTQPALFIIEYAIAKFFTDFGINPNVLIGHSIGEYAAACLSGVFSLEDGLKIVIKRGSLMQTMPGGSMLAVKNGIEKLQDLKTNLFEIAAVNAPDLCTISIKTENVNEVQKLFTENDIEYIPLNTSHAFHSAAFDPILGEFEDYVAQFKLNEPQIPFISCVTGEFINPETATAPSYWAKQLRESVMFNKGINSIAELGEAIFLEVGPNTHLSSLVRRDSELIKNNTVLMTLGKPNKQDEQSKLVSTLGRLWSYGIQLDFERLYPEKPNKIVLPGYPFDRKRYWIERIPVNNSEIITPSLNNEKSLNNHDHGGNGQERKIEKPANTTEELEKILFNLTGFDKSMINRKDTFTDLGIESLFLTQFAQNIEKKYKLKIEFRQLIHDYPNIETLSGYIDTTLKTQKFQKPADRFRAKGSENFVPFKTGNNKIPLVFVHGDNCNNFLPKNLDQDQPYWGFLHLGADGEKYPYNNIKNLARYCISQLLKYKSKGPFVLGGHSFGGIVAYEMAVQLTKMGHKIPLLILSDSILLKKTKLFASISGLKTRLIIEAKWNYCNLLLSLKQKIPVKMRNFYILHNYDRMADKYEATDYNGKILLIKASQTEVINKFLNWDKTAKNISVVELDGGHNEMINNKETIIKYTEAVNQGLKSIEVKNMKVKVI